MPGGAFSRAETGGGRPEGAPLAEEEPLPRLQHPEAQALLGDATLTAAAVRGCRDHLTQFRQRYWPRFYRAEQRELATVVVQGRLSGLERKTSEPLALQAGRPRKP